MKSVYMTNIPQDMCNTDICYSSAYLRPFRVFKYMLRNISSRLSVKVKSSIFCILTKIHTHFKFKYQMTIRRRIQIHIKLMESYHVVFHYKEVPDKDVLYLLCYLLFSLSHWQRQFAKMQIYKIYL